MTKFRGIYIQVGDTLKVTICKDVTVVGVVTFDDAAYYLKDDSSGVDRLTPLTSYSHSCKFKLI